MNGMEKDDEIKGDGISYTSHYRGYDSRIARWYSLDPVQRPNMTMYCGFSNNPIIKIDPRGDDDFFSSSGKYMFSTPSGNAIKVSTMNEVQMKSVLATKANYLEVIEASSRPLNTVGFWTATGSASSFFNNLNKHYESYLKDGNTRPAEYGGTYNSLGGSLAHKDGGEFLIREPSIQIGLEAKDLTGNGKNLYYASDLLRTSANYINLLAHERKHYLANHSASGKRDATGDLEHLDAYMAQFEDNSWNQTTTDFKDHHIAMVGEMLANVTQNGNDKQKVSAKSMMGKIEKTLGIRYTQQGAYENVKWVEKNKNGKESKEKSAADHVK